VATTTYRRPAHLQDRRIGLIYDLRKVGPRVRARRTEPQGNLDHLIRQAQGVGAPAVEVLHGGSVANANDYHALTDAWLLAGCPDGIGVAIGTRVRANKITEAKAATAAAVHAERITGVLGRVRRLLPADLDVAGQAHTAFDRGYTEARRELARAQLGLLLGQLAQAGLQAPAGAHASLDGVRVETWMLKRKPWEWEISAEPDAEARSIMIEMVGFDRYLTHQGGHVVHEDGTGKLWARGADKGVQVRCPSTGREYFLFVPPTVTTAREAVAWTFGLPAREYHPDQES
jgi:hypothetical protein